MSEIVVFAWLILAMHMAVCLAHDLPLINGTSIVLLQDGGIDVSEPDNIAIHWSFSLDIFVNDVDSFVHACHEYCASVNFDKLYSGSDRACKYMLVSNVLQHIESNSEFDGLYDKQALQALKAEAELMEIKEQDQRRLAKYSSLLEDAVPSSHNDHDSSSITTPYSKVALIVPSTSKRYKSISELPLLEYFTKSLDTTIAAFDTLSVVLYLGYDEGDAIYDNEANMLEIVSIIQQRAPLLAIKPIKLSGFQGKVVHIWNELTRLAYHDGCEYFFLLGDDVLISTKNWIPRMMYYLQHGSKLLPNFGTVAFYDIVEPSGPTFPVFHSTHLMIFGVETAFNPFFTNSYADPWMCDIYIPFKSSFIAKDVKLYNVVGGGWTNAPRYEPVPMPYEDYIDQVHRARRLIAQWVGLKTPISWNPSTLAYGEEGIYYKDYCAQHESSGCV